jgi:hypothetical protein
VKLDTSQLGRAGELALTLYALITSEGQVELYSPVVDDDHVDLVGAIRGGLPVIGLQVKTENNLDKDGLVEARASYPQGTVREDPAFLYAVLLLQSVEIRAAWLVPSPDFNRMAYRTTAAGREVLEFRAYPDRQDKFSAFQVDPQQLGPVLISKLNAIPSAPDWLVGIRGSGDRVM